MTTVWIVTKPSGRSRLDDICFEANGLGLERQFRGGMKGSEIVGFYTKQADAVAAAKQELWNRTTEERAADDRTERQERSAGTR